MTRDFGKLRLVDQNWLERVLLRMPAVGVVCISLTADGPQCARPPIPPILYCNVAILLVCRHEGPFIAATKKLSFDVVVVVVFFTLTDRASTIPSNTRGCQSGTWSAGHLKLQIFDVKSSLLRRPFYSPRRARRTAIHTTTSFSTTIYSDTIILLLNVILYTVFQNQLLHRGGRLPVQRRCSTHHVAAMFE